MEFEFQGEHFRDLPFKRDEVLEKINSLEDVKRLVESGTSVNKLYKQNYTLLHKAVLTNNLAVFKYLLSRNDIDVNVCNDFSSTPLSLASSNDNLDMVKCLIDAGASIQCSAFHIAIERNNLEIFEYLLSLNKINVNMSKYERDAPLHLAVHDGKLEMVKRLVERGADVNLKGHGGCTALHFAVEQNNLEILEYLISVKDVQVNVCNSKGYTPLILAVQHNKLDWVKRLIDGGADVNYYKFRDSSPPLHWALNQPAMCRFLIQNGANINATCKDGYSALHLAVASNYLETVCMLLYFNADANIPDKEKETPFHSSLKCRKVEMQRVLLDYVVDFNAETAFGRSILELAINRNNPIVFDIIERGATLDLLSSERIFLFVLRQCSNNCQPIVSVWSKLKGSVNMMLIFDFLEKDNSEKVIHEIIESENFKVAVHSFTKYKNLDEFINRFSSYNLKLDQLTKLICRLLSEGYQLTARDINKVYSNYGYCELFKICLYTSLDSYSWVPWLLVTRLIFDFRSDVNEILSEEIFIDKEMTEHAFQFAVNPVLLNAYLYKYGEEVSAKVVNLPKVPSLLELARNKARKHIADVFACQTTCQFYTRINYLNIPDDYKEILTFERKLYEF